MGVKKETALQERIQRYIRANGGYVFKNHGSMITEPGRADLTACYRGFYIALEVKEDDNKPSRQQIIHRDKVIKAGGVAEVVRSVDEVKEILRKIDNKCFERCL